MAKRDHERTDANARAVAWTAIGLVAGAVLMQYILVSWFGDLQKSERPAPVSPEPLLEARKGLPAPRLQSNPRVELRTYLAAENKLLSTYGWVDKKKGIVRIPIERAMDLMLSGRERHE